MFERFTDRARRATVLAQEEARLLDHNYIGTEHLLLGLIHEGEGVAAKSLDALGVSLEAVRERIEETIGRGGPAPAGHIPFTPRSKKVLEFALREALQLGHNYIGTEHILLGLIREGEGVAAQVLTSFNLDLSRVRSEVIRQMTGSNVPDPALVARSLKDLPEPSAEVAAETEGQRVRSAIITAALSGRMVPSARLTAVQLLIDSAIAQLISGDTELALETLQMARTPAE